MTDQGWPQPQTTWPTPTTVPGAFGTPGGPGGGSGPGPGEGEGGGRKVLIAVVAVVALIAGTFAFVSIRSGGESGYASPEEATEAFFGALGDEDVIGMLQAIDPAERDVMQPVLVTVRDELARLGIIKNVDLGHVPGVDFTVSDLEVEATELLPGVNEVNLIGGTLTIETKPDTVPIGDVLRNLLEATGGDANFEETKEELPFDEGAPFLIAAETDGRWHLSLFFTLAELARRDAGLDLPDPDQAVQAQGADSAEDAVRAFVEAATALDVRKLIALLPPDEMRVVQLYASLFLGDVEAEIDEFRADADFEIGITDLEFDSTSVEGGTRLTPTTATVEVTTDDGTIKVAYDGECLTLGGDGEIADELSSMFDDNQVCRGDVESDVSDFVDASELPELSEFAELSNRFSDLKTGVVVVKRDGKFFVDPLRTVIDPPLQMLKGLDRADFEEGGVFYRLITGDLSIFEFEEFTDYSDFTDDYSS